MRRAKPHELKTRAVPAMTAQMSESELLEWVPVPFDDITDPLETPEPSKGALIELDAGGYLVLYYGEDSHQLTVEIPESTRDSSALVSEFLREVPLPVSRVLWHRPDIALPKHRRRVVRTKTARASSSGELRDSPSAPKRSARRVSLPKKRR